MSWYPWKPYVSAAERRARARRKMQRLRKKGLDVRPVEIQGRQMARTFWGQAWCVHLEKFSDFANRLPRGRTYVRNGSVCHLEIAEGKVKAMVSGSKLYDVTVIIKKLQRKKWSQVKKRCAGQIGSVLELLQGRLSKSVMAEVTHRDHGLFPLPKEIGLHCSCPDWAIMCKHVAAVLYGVGARLDEQPELLFLLRGVNHEELIAAGSDVAAIVPRTGRPARRHISKDSLGEIFGIDLAEDEAPGGRDSRRRAGTTSAARSPASRSARSGKTARTVPKPPRKRTKSSKKAPPKKASAKKKATRKPPSTKPAAWSASGKTGEKPRRRSKR